MKAIYVIDPFILTYERQDISLLDRLLIKLGFKEQPKREHLTYLVEYEGRYFCYVSPYTARVLGVEHGQECEL